MRPEARSGPAGLRWVLVLILLFLVSGCSVKFLYGHADRIAVWRAEDYVDLDRAQRDWLRARMRVLLHWHRTEQLPVWAETLRDLDLAVQDGIDGPTLDRYRERAEGWSDAILVQAVPTLAELLAGLTPEQRAELPERLEEANRELNEDYAGLDEAEQREVWRGKVRDFLEDWIGRLTPAQEMLLDAAAAEVVADNEAWIDYRRRWQDELLDLIAEKRRPEVLGPALLELSLDREELYTPEYSAVRARNDRVLRRFAVDLLGSLEDDQLDRLSGRLRSLAEDFRELAADAGRPPPEPGPAPGLEASQGD
ncbi:MAG: DUF6279 family lipoprotein [Gammaproteobacteria bacterium]|nr:DUF6279 family lipoprotein [Gammaproteobacteria bacterium]